MTRLGQSGAAESRWRTVLALTLIVACGVTVYSNSFTDLFVGLDGKQSIRDNPHIRHVWPPSEALSLPMWTPPVNLAETPTIARRPIFSLSLALTNRFVGSEPWAHHAVNLAIHIAAALTLFGLVGRTTKMQSFSGLQTAESTWLALAVALIWLVHPLQTESVTYIVQRAESLMGLLLLLTVYCGIRALDGPHRRWWQTAAVLACLAGAGCKQTIAVAPILVVLHDYCFVSRLRTQWSRPVFYAVLVAAAWIPPLTYAGKIGAYVGSVSPLPYALAQPAVVLHYLRLSLWPDDLFLYVNTTSFQIRSAAQVVVPATVLLVLFAATLRCLVRRRWLGFLGAWFFVTLGPTSSFVPISDVIQEHRMYVPLAALAVLTAVVGKWALSRPTRALSERGRVAVEAMVLAAVVLALGARTYARNWDYHREFSMVPATDLHEDYTILADHYLSTADLIRAEGARARAMLRSPDRDAHDVVFAHFILGLDHAHRGQPRRAAAELRLVLGLDPDFAYAHHHLGIVLREVDDLPGAIAQFREAIRINPRLVHAYKELAVTLEQSGDTAGAEEQLHNALLQQPGFGEALFELGILAQRRGDQAEAVSYFREAVRYRPDLAEPHYELGMLAMQRGDAQHAQERLAAVVRLRPDSTEARKALGVALARLGRREEARRQLEMAIEQRPDYAEAYNELAIVLREEGHLEEAATQIAHALRLDPESADFHYQLGRLHLEKRDHLHAIDEFRISLARNPNHYQANYDLADALASSGDPTAALPYLERACQLQAGNAEAARRLEELRNRIAGEAVPASPSARVRP